MTQGNASKNSKTLFRLLARAISCRSKKSIAIVGRRVEGHRRRRNDILVCNAVATFLKKFLATTIHSATLPVAAQQMGLLPWPGCGQVLNVLWICRAFPELRFGKG